jgi:hypothetical protein
VRFSGRNVGQAPNRINIKHVLFVQIGTGSNSADSFGRPQRSHDGANQRSRPALRGRLCHRAVFIPGHRDTAHLKQRIGFE